MGGKKGAPSAKDKAATKLKQEALAKTKDQEEAEWAAAGEGKKSKAQARRESRGDERAEAQAKRAEARKLADEEAAVLGAAAAKPKKITQFELRKQEEADRRAAAERTAAKEREVRREVDAGTYDKLVAVDNQNDSDAIDAHNVEQALAQLGVEESAGGMKFADYHAQTLSALKAEKPGLKAPQYKDIIWKRWQRAPENPGNLKK